MTRREILEEFRKADSDETGSFEKPLKIALKKLSALDVDEDKSCSSCKFCNKVFDGMYGETWTCPYLKKFLSILNVAMDEQERKEFNFSIQSDFGCIFYKNKKDLND